MQFAAMLLPILLAAASLAGVSSEKTLAEVEKMFGEIDADGDGCVTWAEHAAAQAENPDKYSGEVENLKKLDKDGSDCIDMKEITGKFRK